MKAKDLRDLSDTALDEHIATTQQFKGSTDRVHETFRQGGQTARNILASGS